MTECHAISLKIKVRVIQCYDVYRILALNYNSDLKGNIENIGDKKAEFMINVESKYMTQHNGHKFHGECCVQYWILMYFSTSHKLGSEVNNILTSWPSSRNVQLN